MNEQLVVEQTLKYAEEFSVLYADERAARERAEEALSLLTSSYDTTVRALARALELRDDATGSHAGRVTERALELTRSTAPELADDPALAYGFLLHDIGKIGIPDGVLRKAGPLDDPELALMRTHPELGARIVADIPFLSGVARDVIASHHERWDGSGYPRGLKGDAIPLSARIFSIVDAFDAMANDRPYRAALPMKEVRASLAAAAGSQFEAALVETFLELELGRDT